MSLFGTCVHISEMLISESVLILIVEENVVPVVLTVRLNSNQLSENLPAGRKEEDW